MTAGTLSLAERHRQLQDAIYPQLGCNTDWARANPRKLQSVRGRYITWCVLFMRFGYGHEEIARVSRYDRTTVIYGIKVTLRQPTGSEDGQLLDWLMAWDVETRDEDDLED